jgi:hypothetical protein
MVRRAVESDPALAHDVRPARNASAEKQRVRIAVSSFTMRPRSRPTLLTARKTPSRNSRGHTACPPFQISLHCGTDPRTHRSENTQNATSARIAQRGRTGKRVRADGVPAFHGPTSPHSRLRPPPRGPARRWAGRTWHTWGRTGGCNRARREAGRQPARRESGGVTSVRSFSSKRQQKDWAHLKVPLL